MMINAYHNKYYQSQKKRKKQISVLFSVLGKTKEKEKLFNFIYKLNATEILQNCVVHQVLRRTRSHRTISYS